jgi:hypothetical protein
VSHRRLRHQQLPRAANAIGVLQNAQHSVDAAVRGVVEFAVRLPGGKFVPIDSKWPAAGLLDRLANETDPARRDAIVRELERTVSAKAEEVARYLDPERTLLLGVAALPDAVYQLCRLCKTTQIPALCNQANSRTRRLASVDSLLSSFRGGG